MKNKFLKMTFMALCLSTSSVVHAMHEEGDEETVHAPVLFSGEYEVAGAKFLEPEYGSVTIHQSGKSILVLQVNLNDSPGLRDSQDPKVLQPLLKLSESDFPNNFVALHYNDRVSTSEVTRYYGEKTVENFKMAFDFRISDTPIRGPGEKGFQLLVQSVLPVVSKTVFIPATEINSWKETKLNFGEDSLKRMPTIRFSLFKKADDQSAAQDSNPGPSSSSSSSSSSSTPTVTPAFKPELELDIPEFHMGESNPYPSSGFSGFEGTHRWTEGKKATISFSDMTPRPSHVSFFDTRGLVTGDYTQDLIVKLNGTEVDRHVYSRGENNYTINIALPKTGPAEIEFEIPKAISPFKLVGTNPDKRELGILFGEVQFRY